MFSMMTNPVFLFCFFPLIPASELRASVYATMTVLLDTHGAVLEDGVVDRLVAHALSDLEPQAQVTLRLTKGGAKHAYAGGLTTASIAEAAATVLGTVAGSHALDSSRISTAVAALACTGVFFFLLSNQGQQNKTKQIQLLKYFFLLLFSKACICCCWLAGWD